MFDRRLKGEGICPENSDCEPSKTTMEEPSPQISSENRTPQRRESTCQCLPLTKVVTKRRASDFPGGTVVKNPLAKAGDMGSIPGPGGSHMPWSN